MEFKSFIFSLLCTFSLSVASAEQILRWSPITVLHPTQSAIGQLAVDEKKAFLKTLSGSKLNKYLNKNPVPVVRGPNNVFYMTDHHHMARGLYELKMDRVMISVIGDFSDLNEVQFWNKMMDRDLAYLIDENGREITPNQIPDQVKDMKDDIYRSLSYFVREKGGYEKTNIAFAEFEWAEFYRNRISSFDLKTKWGVSLQRALNMAHCPDAKNLPGYNRGPCER